MHSVATISTSPPGQAKALSGNLVRMRLDGPGMRWSRGRSECVLHLRCILLNGQWDDFTAYLARRGSLPLAATPMPTVTHNAAKKALNHANLDLHPFHIEWWRVAAMSQINRTTRRNCILFFLMCRV